MLGELAILYEERRVSVGGRPVELTATEYELLRVLSLNAGRVTTYDTLLRKVWGGRKNGGSARLRTALKKLRRKLGEDAAQPRWIFAERGVGYRTVRQSPAGTNLFYVIHRDATGGMRIDPYRAYLKKDGAIGRNFREYREGTAFAQRKFLTSEDAALLGRLGYFEERSGRDITTGR